MAMQRMYSREAQGGGHDNSLQGCTVHGFFMDCPRLGHGLSMAFHGLFRDCSGTVQGLFMDCPCLVHGSFIDFMVCLQTVHGLFMVDCPWLVHGLFMACL